MIRKVVITAALTTIASFFIAVFNIMNNVKYFYETSGGYDDTKNF